MNKGFHVKTMDSLQIEQMFTAQFRKQMISTTSTK